MSFDPGSGVRPKTRARVLGFVALCVACVAVTVVYVAHADRRERTTSAGTVEPAAPTSVQAVQDEPYVVFRTLAAGEAGHLALAPLAESNGARTVTDLECLRVYFAAGNGLCLKEKGELFTPYDIVFLGPDLQPRHKESLAGLISRARISPDGRYGTATVFVTGHSYAPGTFSTQTTLYEMATGELLGDLEGFEVIRNGKRIESPDFNFWGVTFARQPGVFYATLGTAGHTYLVRGDIDTLTMEVLRDDVECPSMSPDGTRIAFKQRVGSDAGLPRWRPAVLDVATLESHLLAETRTIDDQIEWLDDNTVLYAIDTGLGAPDTWSVPADGTGQPAEFLTDGDSPAVVRPN